MELAAALPISHLRVPLLARTPGQAIDELLDTLGIEDDLVLAAARRAVLAREAEASTGIGGGVAIPHGRTDRVEGTLCALGLAPEGIEWAAIDGRPCRLILLCVTHPVQAERHLLLLGELAGLLNDRERRSRLAGATTPAEARVAIVGV